MISKHEKENDSVYKQLLQKLHKALGSHRKEMKTVLVAAVLALLLVATISANPVAHPEELSPEDFKVLKGKLCGLCKTIVGTAENLGEKYTKDWLEKEIDILCDALLFLAHECKKEVGKIIDKLDDFINKHAGPDVACKAIDFC